MLGPQKKRKSPLYILTSIVVIVALALLASSAAVFVAAAVLLTVIFYPLFLWLWDYLYGVKDIADQLFYAVTEDGWSLALHFHRPPYPRQGALPVVVCHGIANNKYGVDMDRSHSVAYYLKQHGFPVFAVSLRGVGKSFHRSPDRWRDFNFDDIVERDVPAILNRVMQLTGAPAVNWVGHSMGGMILYGFLGRQLEGHEKIASLVALGSPGRIDHAHRQLWGVITRYPWLNEILDFKFGAQVISPLTGRISTPVDELIFTRENVSPSVIRRLMKNGVENISYGLARQLVGWIESGRETTADQTFNYREGLANITTPTLFLSGARDQVAVPESVEFAYRNVASEHKEYVCLGREIGLPTDYCHTGLVLGERAIHEVYPRVQEWLEQHGIEHKSEGFFGRILRRFTRRRRRSRNPAKNARRLTEHGRPSDVIQA